MKYITDLYHKIDLVKTPPARYYPDMKSIVLPTEIARKSANFERLAHKVIGQPTLLEEVFAGLGAEKARIKYGCLKVLRIISEQQASVLYPAFDRLTALVDSENQLLKRHTV